MDVYPKVYYGKAARDQMEKYVKDKEKWESSNGYYNPPENEVYIFRKDVPEQCIIGFLAHEMRHAYQCIQKKQDFNFYEDWYELNDPYYRCRKTELDANEFAYKYCKDNNIGIRIILHYLEKKMLWKLTRGIHKCFGKHTCP